MQGRGRLLAEGLVLGAALARSRRGLTYDDLCALLGCRYRTALRWAQAAERAGLVTRCTDADGRTRLVLRRAGRRRGRPGGRA